MSHGSDENQNHAVAPNKSQFHNCNHIFNGDLDERDHLMDDIESVGREELASNEGNAARSDEGVVDERSAYHSNSRLELDEQCGCGCHQRWMQRCANRNVFLLVFCLSSVVQGMFYTYFVSCLTTIEKVFQVRSSTTGVIMSTTEVGQIGGSLLLAYYGGGGHRPRWIAGGILLFGISAFLCSLPHFLFGHQLVQELLASTPSQEAPLSTANLCLSSTKANSSVLDGQELTKECINPGESSFIVLGLFFVALLGVGIGQTTVYNLGIPYIDDNIASQDSPTYLGITIGIRIFGPTLGFVLGAVCTSLPINPFATYDYGPTDPRWIGAWWIGLVFISLSLITISFMMMLFPRRLHRFEARDIPIVSKEISSCCNNLHKNSFPENEPSELHHQNKTVTEFAFSNKRSLTDFLEVIRRLITNRALVLRTFSSVLHLLPIAGLYTFLPKYLETQFRVPVHSAAMISGVGGIMVMGFGIFLSGFVIRKVNPLPRSVAFWIALTALLYSIGMFGLMFLGCSRGDILGRPQTMKGQDMQFEPPCHRNCNSCDDKLFAPICSSEGEIFFSACHVGCSSVSLQNETQVVFSDCDCLGEGATARLRFCDSPCPSSLMWYVIVFCAFVIIHSTSEVGGMLLTLRCVKPEDKAMALGLISFAIGLFGNVPCPVLYGAVIDNACIHWRHTCSQSGACQIYDSNSFRRYFHGLTALLMFLAFLVDVAVWFCADDINFDDEMRQKMPVAYEGYPLAASVSPSSDPSSHLIKYRRPASFTSGSKPAPPTSPPTSSLLPSLSATSLTLPGGLARSKLQEHDKGSEVMPKNTETFLDSNRICGEARDSNQSNPVTSLSLDIINFV